ncbi:hypothetical protein EDC04DRAFT_2681476 [Pisolithus marmoratus]|nr:hypothetical protein EDC04DRAFT_2681476 [Pisolithus marmoratus]
MARACKRLSIWSLECFLALEIVTLPLTPTAEATDPTYLRVPNLGRNDSFHTFSVNPSSRRTSIPNRLLTPKRSYVTTSLE